MAYKYHVSSEYLKAESLGQSWAGGGTIDHEIGLCSHQTIEPHFRKHLPKTGRILEAGCGLGRWVFYLRRLGYDVSGVEYSRKALQMIQAYDPAAPITFGDVLKLDMADSSLDALISLGVVEHFEEGPEQALRESARVLRPGGTLLLSIPARNPLRMLWTHPMLSLKQAIQRLRGKTYGFYEYRFGTAEFAAKLKAAGFEVEEVVVDDFVPPLSIGLFTDFPALHKPGRQWELNALGVAVDRILKSISPWISHGGVLFICKARK